MTYTEIPQRLPPTYHCPHCRQFHPRGRPQQVKEKRPCQRRT
jgi:hypothetical protein